MKTFALLGNPNSGKTTLFNSLTGSTAHVGNWPGVTVDKKEGIYKKTPSPVALMDLPGIYSLSPYTPEEVISRNYILDTMPDCVINIVDATNLERNLYLTTQIMEMDVPVVVALNMIDAVEKSGDSIDVAQLESHLGVPVVKISALKEKGLHELMLAAYEASEHPRKGFSVLEGSRIMPIVRDCEHAIENAKIANPLFHAVKLVESDEVEMEQHPSVTDIVESYRSSFHDDLFGNDFEAFVADARYRYIEANYSIAYKRNEKNRTRLDKATKADKVLTHKVWGIPIFLVILFSIFHITFSENFLFIGGALPEGWVSLAGTPFEGVFGDGGINSIGVVLQSLTELLTDTISDAMASGMAAAGAAEWAIGFVCDGIWAGIAGVLSFLPQILLLFLLFSILEDSGYMARVAFILDKVFRKFGLSGRAFMPLIMGFGCSVPAMINTRTLADKNERIATVRVIPFFSCGAKLPILTAIAGAIFSKGGGQYTDLFTFGMYLIGITVAIVTVLLMRNTSIKGDTTPFIMELPAYNIPQFKNTMLLLWDKLKHFIKKACTIILLSTIVIWFVSHFSFDWKFLEDAEIEQSILAGIGKLIQPLFTPLGFGAQLGSWGWVFAVAAITGLIAKENVISTFSVLAACITAGFVESGEGVDSVLQMVSATGITVPALISFIVFNMTTIPCFATVATAKGELIEGKSFRNTMLFWIVTSFTVSTIVYLVGAYWWTIFIFAPVIVAATTLVVLYGKGKLPKFSMRKKAVEPSNASCENARDDITAEVESDADKRNAE